MYEKLVIVGALTRTPDMRYTAGGTPVTNIGVAVTKKISKTNRPECPDGWTSSYNEKHWQLTKYYRVTVWGPQAESVNEYLDTGSLVMVEGTLTGEGTDGVENPRIWETSEGVPRASWEMRANSVLFLSFGRQSTEEYEDAEYEEEEEEEEKEEEYPF